MITLEHNELHCKIALSGEIGIYNINELKQGLLDAFCESESMEVDLSKVSELDTSVVQVLLCARKDADRQGKQLQLKNHSNAVIQVFDLYNLGSVFGDPVVLSARQ